MEIGALVRAVKRNSAKFEDFIFQLTAEEWDSLRCQIGILKGGNPGDHRFLGDMVSEMRIDYGPGYRVYYKDTGEEIIILLCGGDKSTQQADIARAKEIAGEV